MYYNHRGNKDIREIRIYLAWNDWNIDHIS